MDEVAETAQYIFSLIAGGIIGSIIGMWLAFQFIKLFDWLTFKFFK